MSNGRTTSVELPHNVEGPGLTGKTAMVHKEGAEGILLIDALTGHVIPGQQDRPEWAEGLVLAQLAERHLFYTNRLGPQYADKHKAPELFAFEDIGWLGVDMATGDPIVSEASDEHRMNVVGTVLGIDRETGSVKGSLAEAEIARDDTRTEGELKDFRAAQDKGYKEAPGTNG